MDLLIVGGGPCGTAAAWRAHELGLSVLVVDRDCVLSILREWGEHQPNPKKVDAEYGDCSEMPFPQGGSLVSNFPYEDQTPANVLYEKWLKVYDDNKIPYRNGVELGGCERLPDGVLAAECMELQTQAKTKVHAKSLLLALGSGSPAKVRVMGDGLGIRYKLGNAADYVGAPACVVGGGMSAAEAVVSIALSKAAAKDNSDIFWCYRGRSMPKVAQGKALAGKFYEAWMAGNIRYLPLAEPLAVFKDDQGTEYVAVKTRRVEQSNQPPELVCYEFEKKRVLAFIGSERPVDLLSSIGTGIREFSAADAPAKKRLAVSPLREAQVKGVFLAGGLLDPAFIETADFRPEALQSTVKEHPGCFKTAIIDGVRAAETVHQRLAGGASDDVIREQIVKQNQTMMTMIVPAKTPAAPPVPAPVAAPEPTMGAAFVHIGPGENAAKHDHFFAVGDSIVGRTAGRVVIAADALLLDQHAAFRVDADECYVTNVPYGGECYVRFNSERTVQPGTVIVAGRQRLRVDIVNGKVTLSRLDSKGVVAKSIPLAREERTIGRDDLDPRDFALSRSHLSVSDAGSVARVRDASRNGTFLELRGALRLNEGDEVWMGEQRFRFVEMRSEVIAAGTATFQKPAAPPAALGQTQTSMRRPSAPEPAPAPAAPAAPAARAPAAPAPAPAPAAPAPAAPAGEPAILLADGTKIPAASDRPMLSFLSEAGAATDDSGSIGDKCQTLWECWDENEPSDSGGSCGKCVVTILEGMASLNEAGSREKNTIKKANKKLGGKLDEAKCRLACQAVVQGPVKIQPTGNTGG
ncbi:MAG TPA: NAD(P)-binding domain-containing protein [Planctomycetota bacterium]|nr:NAD(P)-binding domain-containing protein [Planctomycetota bacterium]